MEGSLKENVLRMARQARSAAQRLSSLTPGQKDRWLQEVAQALRQEQEELLTANARDIEQAPEYGLSAAATDRLRLTPSRLENMAAAVEQIAALSDPVGEILEGSVRPNGLRIQKVRVPLGVIFFIYESRPNVTVDAACLCVKSGNAVILRGGKEAFHSNRALHQLLTRTLSATGLPPEAVQFVATTDRAAVGKFLQLREWIDVTIPRGGKSLIERVTAEATMPVLKHYDGNCHVYVEASASLTMAAEIVLNAKCQRPGVCNAAESLLVHTAVADAFLPQIASLLKDRGVTLRGCPRTCRVVPEAEPASEEDYRTEYLDLILSVKIVDSTEEAIEHINTYGSHHTDAIITQDLDAAALFTNGVDSSAVMVNASTRFNDGGEFGLGAEIGISTDKFHARGPCGLRELTSYKYIVQGTGHIRT